MAFSPDSRYCAVESPGSGVTIKSVETGLPVTKLDITLGEPNWMYFSPDGKRLLVADFSSGMAEVLDIEKNEPLVSLLSHNKGIHNISVYGDKFLTIMKDLDREHATVQLFENDGKKVRWRIRVKNQKHGSDDDARYMSFETAVLSPDNNLVALIVDTEPLMQNSRGILLVDAADGNVVKFFPAHQSEISKIMFSPNGQTLFTASRDSSIKVWDVPAGTLKKSFTIGSTVYSMVLHGDTVAALTYEGDFKRKVVKIDLLTENKTEVILISGTSTETFDNVSKIAFSADASQVALSYNWENAILWNTVNGKVDLVTSLGRNQAVGSLAFSPDGKQLAVGGTNNIIQIWDTRAKKVNNDAIKILTPNYPYNTNKLNENLRHMPFYTSVAFSADGKTLLAGTADANLIKLNVPLITSVGDFTNQNIAGESSVYPNPASSTVIIPFSLKSEKIVSLCIFDINGQELDCILKEKALTAGDYTEEYSVEKLAAGIYYYTLRINNVVYQHKFSVVR